MVGCVTSSNTADAGAGVFAQTSGGLELTSNTADRGGAVKLYSASGSVVASDNSAVSGEAVSLEDEDLECSGDCSFTSNTASDAGGAVHLLGGSTLEAAGTDWGSEVTDNRPDDSWRRG